MPDEHALTFLLAFNGRIHHLEHGYWINFEITRLQATPERPHGLRYSFTLHAPDGRRLLGFDNAHPVAPRGARFRREVTHDHWHRTEGDVGRPYRFSTVEQLLTDFENEVVRTLDHLGISPTVVAESSTRTRKEP